MNRISRDEARALGLVHFFTGAPCRYGHIATRYVQEGKCCECLKLRGTPQRRRYRASGRGWAGNMLSGARRRARKQGVPCTLSVSWIKAQLKRGECAVSGLPFDLTTGQGRWVKLPFTPSLDRKVPLDGYTEENCRVVCLIVNEAMNRWGFTPLMRLAVQLTRGTAPA